MPTRLLDEQGKPKYINRLIDSSSPYLVQHAHNPVDWFPWGDEAFEEASRQNKPVFLSVGYSTCHWCHVMERESFDNEAIAQRLNRDFVSIKLDREQHPDVDEFYMTGLQLMTGQGGWPMSCFLTSEGKPFFTGSYFAPEEFSELLGNIQQAWESQREDVLHQAEQIYAAIEAQTSATKQAREVDDGLISAAVSKLLASFDENLGGFGGAPKFPNEPQLELLATVLQHQDAPEAEQAFLFTLSALSEGGIYDQVGSGFHRYSVDAKWHIPHFEKMLYNQSQLLALFAWGSYLDSGRGFARIVDQLLAYLRREMWAVDGGFFSASDADTEGQEGAFFVWSYQELKDLLGNDQLALLEDLFGVTAAGNFANSNSTKNVLYLTSSLEQYAVKTGEPLSLVRERVDQLRQTLLDLRAKRPVPFLDEKILTAWNGQMISSLVQVEMLTGNRHCRAPALETAEAIWQKHYGKESGMLLRSRLHGQVSVPGTLEDYAYLAEACLRLYLVTRDPVWRNRGFTLVDQMFERFWDHQDGGFFTSGAQASGPLSLRTKNAMDAAMPSGHSMALAALVLASEVTEAPHYRSFAEQMIAASSGRLAESPSAHPAFLSTVQRYRLGSREPVQWAASGKVHVALDGASLLTVSIAPGWHLNHPDVDPSHGLLGLEIAGRAATLPRPEWLATEFNQEAIPVLSGEFNVVLTPDAGKSNWLKIKVQACSDKVCLAPETLTLRLPGASREI